MAEKLTRLQKMKAKNPKRFAEYMALKKRTGRTSRDAARKTRGKISARGGTLAEARALRAGEKAAKAALKAGATVKQADAIGKKTSRGKMKTDRSKTGAEVTWAAASAIPVGGLIVRGARAAKAAGEGIQKLTGAMVKKKAAKKTADAAKKTADAAQKKATEAKWTAKKGKQVYTPPSQAVAKKTASNVKRQTTKAKNLASKSRTASRTATKQQKAVTAANVAGRKPLSTADKLRIGATGGITAINIARQNAEKRKKVPAKPKAALPLPAKPKAALPLPSKPKAALPLPSKPKAALPLPAKPKPKKVAAKPKPKKSPVKRTPAPVTMGDEDIGSSRPGKTITSNPRGEGSSTGLDLETILERIEEREYPMDPDDPAAFDLDDLKADLKELRGYKHGGKVKRNMGGSVRGVGAAKRGFGRATYSDKWY